MTNASLRKWARLLGWKHLRRYTHKLHEREQIQYIVWYASGDYDDTLLQVNLMPSPSACVFAIPYGLCTGWHELRLDETTKSISSEVDRLRTKFDNSFFSSRTGRRVFRAAHPECTHWSWGRIRREGIPRRTGDVIGRRRSKPERRAK